MGLLDKVTTGKIKRPLFMVIFGTPGVGKSTFAAGAPDTLFIGNEEGTFNMDVARLPKARSFEEIMATIKELRTVQHAYQTLAIDALDGLEPLVWDSVCKVDGAATIDLAQGGYGKGYVLANKYWQSMIDALIALREERGMNIIAIAHSQVKAFNDPVLIQPYDRYQMKLNEKAAALWREAVDVLGFANYETFLKKGDTEKKNRALGDGKRVLHTERRPGFDAKNRMGLPPEMDLSFDELMKHAENSIAKPESSDEIIADINTLSKYVSDSTTLSKVTDSVVKAGTDVTKLKPIRDRLKTITKKSA
jgi:hypothetical protein